MGFMSFLQFVVKCFDVLAWPLLALGYPLCASIRAIETNGSSNARTLVTYWVHFSLISLFEHAFVKLLEWVPFWPYIKLMIISWLVIPHFDGAQYVYKHIVRPCLSMEPSIFINQFKKLKDFLLREDNFLAEADVCVKEKGKRDYILAEADRYIKENGSEALEKLFASKLKGLKPYHVEKEIKASEDEVKGLNGFKPYHVEKEIKASEDEVKGLNGLKPYRVEKEIKASADEVKGSGEPKVVQKDIKAVEVTEKKEMTLPKGITQAEPNPVQTEKRTFAPMEIKEATAAATAASGELPQIADSKKVQKEWTCAICQVRTQSEETLISHLQGRRHRDKCEELKTKSQASKSRYSPASASKKSDMPKEVPKNCESSNGLKHRSARSAKESNLPKEEPEKYVSHNQAKRKEKVQVKQEKPKSIWLCTLCNVSCGSSYDLASHLGGKKHLARIEELKVPVGWGRLG